jgi:hypothetical protein
VQHLRGYIKWAAGGRSGSPRQARRAIETDPCSRRRNSGGCQCGGADFRFRPESDRDHNDNYDGTSHQYEGRHGRHPDIPVSEHTVPHSGDPWDELDGHSHSIINHNHNHNHNDNHNHNRGVADRSDPSGDIAAQRDCSFINSRKPSIPSDDDPISDP